jgi:uncharacterized protein (UPF0335 family)
MALTKIGKEGITGISNSSDATAITIDSSENVSIGTNTNTLYYNSTSTYSSSLALKTNTSNEVADIAIINGNNNFGSTIDFARTNTSSNDVRIASLGGYADSNTSGSESGHIRFQTKGASDSNIVERMRIDSNGNVGIGETPTNSRLSVTEQGGGETIANFRNNASSNPYGLYLDFASSAPDNTSVYAFRFEDSSTDRLIIYSDGDIYNHDGTYAQFSDRRIKDNITDANSQWEDIKAMRFVNYQRKDDILQYGAEDAKVQLGLIGQELEAISPNLVREVEPTANDIRHSSELGSLYEEGDEIPEGKQIGDVKEITDQVKGVAYSILYMKAVKALQEAMTRIETLETENATQATQIADLISRVTALENS